MVIPIYNNDMYIFREPHCFEHYFANSRLESYTINFTKHIRITSKLARNKAGKQQ